MSLASGSIDLKSLKVAGEPNKYITYIDNKGIRVHEAGAVNTNFAQINASGMQIYKGGQTDDYKIADFSSTITIGNQNNDYLTLSNDILQLYSQEAEKYVLQIGKQCSVPSLTPITAYAWGATIGFSIESQLNSLNDGDGFIIVFTIDYHQYNCKFYKGTPQTYTLFDNISLKYSTTQSGPLYRPNCIYLEGLSTKTLQPLNTIFYSILDDNKEGLFFSYGLSQNELAGKYSVNLNAAESLGDFSFAANSSSAYGTNSAAFGYHNIVQGEGSSVFGIANIVTGDYSNAEGANHYITSRFAHGEGHGGHKVGANIRPNITGECAHLEGYHPSNETGSGTIVSGIGAHVEGSVLGGSGESGLSNITVSGEGAHFEGLVGYTLTIQQNGDGSHVEGFHAAHNIINNPLIFSGIGSHAEGYNTEVRGNGAHAEGGYTLASGTYSHAGGYGTVASSNYQTTIGCWNDEDINNQYAFIIGNGEIDANDFVTQSNALTVDWSGNVDIASGAKYKINGTALSASDVGAIALSDKYTRSSVGGLDWSNQTDGNAKIISKSALAFWNGSYDGSTSNLTRFKASNGTSYSFGTLASKNSLSAADVGAVPKSVCCFANSVVRTPSSGTITFTLSELGITNNQKPVGILMTYQDGGSTPTILRYDYDASSANGVIVKVYDANGNAVSSAVRFFMMVFQGSWTGV